MLNRLTELCGAEALLMSGVSVPVFDVRVPLTGWRWTVRMRMGMPTLGRQIRIAREWMRMGVGVEELEGMDRGERMRVMAEKGDCIARMIALTLEGGWWRPQWLLRWMVRRGMRWEYQVGAMREFVELLGTDPFLSIIISAERMNPMMPRMSHVRRGS